jgi:hypothetical protein
LPTKGLTTELCSSAVNSSSMVVILTLKPVSEHAHTRLLPRLAWSWTYWCIQKNYYVHYSCFTSICDLFTDSPSYFQYYSNVLHQPARWILVT